MYLNSIKYFCIATCFLNVRCQNDWSSNGGYNSRFANSWNSEFLSGTFKEGKSNDQNGYENNFGNSFGIFKPSRRNGSGTEFRKSDYIDPNRRLNQELQSGENDKNFSGNYDTSPNVKKESSGTFDNWQSDVFNRKPNPVKSNSIKNLPSSSKWSTNTNYNAEFKPLESEKLSAGLNNFKSSSNANWNSNAVNSNNIYNNDNNNQKEVYIKPDYDENSVISSWDLKNYKKSNPTNSFTDSKKLVTTTEKNNLNLEISKWKSNNQNKSKKPSGSNNWNPNSSLNLGKEKIPANASDQKLGSNPSTSDTSILDELDKNDWYFEKESNYPKPPFRSTLNLDVNQLWNFDKQRKKGSDQSFRGLGNNSRKNRQIERSGDVTEGVQCECVSVNSCSEEDMILTQKDLKYDFRPLEAFICKDLTEVCCTNPKTKVHNRTNFKKEKELQCGQRRIRKNSTGMLKGNTAWSGEFPWMLQLESSENHCSATLIHHSLALTAAHCVAGALPREIILKAGNWNSDDESSESSQIRRVARIIPHPDFDIQNPRNDIALLVVEAPFEITENVNTVCLPVTNDKWDSNQCVVGGWRSEEIGGQVVKVLEKGYVSFLPQAECQNMLLTDLWKNYILHDSFFCGLEKTGRQSCTGDEGGFLICPSKKQRDAYLQIGVISMAMNCDNFGRPAIFTNVLKFLDWINANFFELELFDDIDTRSLV